MHLALRLCAARVTSNKLLGQYNWWVFPYGYNSVIYNTRLCSKVTLKVFDCAKSLTLLALAIGNIKIIFKILVWF